MVCRLIDFVLVVLKSLMFKVCGIIGISEIRFFNFSGTGRVKDIRNCFRIEKQTKSTKDRNLEMQIIFLSMNKCKKKTLN